MRPYAEYCWDTCSTVIPSAECQSTVCVEQIHTKYHIMPDMHSAYAVGRWLWLPRLLSPFSATHNRPTGGRYHPTHCLGPIAYIIGHCIPNLFYPSALSRSYTSLHLSGSHSISLGRTVLLFSLILCVSVERALYQSCTWFT